jgi:predicted Zn finger-like uncharacterized protein
MFTVCSKCNLRLTVTATDLRAAQGYVRCGRCHNVFNALAALADDPARQAVPASTADTQQRPVLTQPEPPHPEPDRPERRPPDTSPADIALEFNPASTNINEVFIEAAPGERTGTFESIVLMGDEPAADPPAAPDPVIAPQALSAPVTPNAEDSAAVDVRRMRDALAEPDTRAASPAAAQPAPREPDPPPDAPAAREEPVVAAPDPEPSLVDWSFSSEIASAIDEPPEAALLNPTAGAARLPRWALRAVACLLALGLLAQLVHHYRADLAATALLHGPLTALYQALGVPLAAGWNITDYEIRQLGATTDGAAAGDLVVRASISNKASHDQPLPLLRVVMQDRFGNRVAGRDLKPVEYLGRGAPQVSLMQPGQRVDVQVAFRDPGQSATGFEVDACMADSDHTVTCANDAGGH